MMEIQKDFTDEGDNDRISRLPRGVIDHILLYLPIRDVARTSILSTKWRHVWANHPSLFLDKKFWNDIKRHISSSEPSIDFAGIVNRILLHHVGSIVEFVVDISVISCQRHSDINLWLNLVCRRGVKELSLKNSASNPYTLPSCVFSAPELTYFNISNCTIKTKETLTGFSSLKSLTLDQITLESWVLITPLLNHLSLNHCLGIRGFRISAPNLRALVLSYNDDDHLVPYLMCTNITYACISQNKSIIENRGDIESVNLVKLLCCWPKLEIFYVDDISLLKYLSTDIALEDFPRVLHLTNLAMCDINDHQHIWVLRILRSSPFLQEFQISLGGVATNELEVLNYLEELKIMNHRMERLHTVKFMSFEDSRIELEFMKILLHCSPSLKQMVIKENAYQSSEEKLKILKQLLRFPRASTNAEIIFQQSIC